jgi:hypothetical protein
MVKCDAQSREWGGTDNDATVGDPKKNQKKLDNNCYLLDDKIKCTCRRGHVAAGDSTHWYVGHTTQKRLINEDEQAGGCIGCVCAGCTN